MAEPRIDYLLSELKNDNFEVEKLGANDTFIINIIYFLKENNLNILKNEILKLPTDINRIVLKNLIKLFPLSTPIITLIVHEKYYEEDKLIDIINEVLDCSEELASTIQKIKLKIRNGKSKLETNDNLLQKNIVDIRTEINKNKDIINNLNKQKIKKEQLLKEKEKYENEIKNIKKILDVSGLDDLEKQWKKYSDMASQIDEFKAKINESRKIYVNIIKDDEEA